MILFFMGRPMHSGITKTTQVQPRSCTNRARSTPIAWLFTQKYGVSNLGRALIGAKHAQRSRGGQGAWPLQFFAVWATISK
jgi:hypothetical protein